MTTSPSANAALPTSLSPFRLPRITPLGLIERCVERCSGLSRMDRYYRDRPRDGNPSTFLNYSFDVLGINYQIIKGQIESIPTTGPLIIVANHPLGMAEGMILLAIIRQVRTDVKALANQYLKRVPELADLFIAVDVFETKDAVKANIKALREAQQHLQDGGVLLLFPAGEVSIMNLRSGELQDKEWSRSVARLVRRNQVTTLPIYINARNSKAFYLAGKIHPMLRTLMLGRELLNKQRQTIEIAIGETIDYSEVRALDNDDNVVSYLRMNTYLLGADCTVTNLPESHGDKIIDPIDTVLLQGEIDQLESDELLLAQDDFFVYCTSAKKIPNLLREIGRIREVNFRATGEGTGLACDLDVYDQHYRHLFIWDRGQQQLVGAYRLGLLNNLLTEQGPAGLYSRSLFQYDQRLTDQLGNGIEMGRSVIDEKYQRSLGALLLLWKGIATYVYRHPHYTHLFGPVSISSEYSTLARHLITATLSVHHYDHQQAGLVKATMALPKHKGVFWHKGMLSALADIKLLSKILGRMERGKGVPVLLRQYLTLNGKFICFNVDQNFNNALDGLIVVDLRNVPARTLSRYMGKVEATEYLALHQAKQE